MVLGEMDKFAKVYFAKYVFAMNSPKFAPANVSLYTVYVMYVHTHTIIIVYVCTCIRTSATQYRNFLCHMS